MDACFESAVPSTHRTNDALNILIRRRSMVHPYIAPRYAEPQGSFALFSRLPPEISAIILSMADASDICNLHDTGDRSMQQQIMTCYHRHAFDRHLVDDHWRDILEQSKDMNAMRYSRGPQNYTTRSLYNLVSRTAFPRILQVNVVTMCAPNHPIQSMVLQHYDLNTRVYDDRSETHRNIVTTDTICTSTAVHCDNRALQKIETTHLIALGYLLPFRMIQCMPLTLLAVADVKSMSPDALQQALPATVTTLKFSNVLFTHQRHDEVCVRFESILHLSLIRCTSNYDFLNSSPVVHFDVPNVITCHVHVEHFWGSTIVTHAESTSHLQMLVLGTANNGIISDTMMHAIGAMTSLSSLRINVDAIRGSGLTTQNCPRFLTSLTITNAEAPVVHNAVGLDTLPRTLQHLTLCEQYYLVIPQVAHLPQTLVTLVVSFLLTQEPVEKSIHWMTTLEVLHMSILAISPKYDVDQMAFLQSAALLPLIRTCTGVPFAHAMPAIWPTQVQTYECTMKFDDDVLWSHIAIQQAITSPLSSIRMHTLYFTALDTFRLQALPPNLTSLSIIWKSTNRHKVVVPVWTHVLAPLTQLRHLLYDGWNTSMLRRDLHDIRMLPLESLALTSQINVNMMLLKIFDHNLPHTLRVFACATARIHMDPCATLTNGTTRRETWDWFHLPPTLETILLGIDAFPSMREESESFKRRLMAQKEAMLPNRTMHVHVTSWCPALGNDYQKGYFKCRRCLREPMIRYHLSGTDDICAPRDETLEP